MKMSKLFTKTRRETPQGVDNISTALLIRGGFVDKLMAGVYTYLPLGWRVHRKIEEIIREEMEEVYGQEIFMPALQPREIWEKTNRWEELKGVMYQLKDSSGKDMALGFTHEEVISAIAKQYILSYKDLPKAVFQIQTKFRDEPRAKSGLLRGREFIMKDLYSFHGSEEDLNKYYDRVAKAYLKIFERCGLQAKITEAGGGVFSKSYSHEFQVLAEVGEDKVIYCESCDFSQNVEIAKTEAGQSCPKCKKKLQMGKGIEVGNIFKLGTKFSESFGINFSDKEGKLKPVVMASYGIGLGRLMGTVAETHFDENGLIWPKGISPYDVHLINLGVNEGEEIYQKLNEAGIDVLYDDRDSTAGEKLADADLIGITHRIIISPKTLANQAVEVQRRIDKSSEMVKIEEIVDKLKEILGD